SPASIRGELCRRRLTTGSGPIADPPARSTVFCLSSSGRLPAQNHPAVEAPVENSLGRRCEHLSAGAAQVSGGPSGRSYHLGSSGPDRTSSPRTFATYCRCRRSKKRSATSCRTIQSLNRAHCFARAEADRMAAPCDAEEEYPDRRTMKIERPHQPMTFQQSPRPVSQKLTLRSQPECDR